MTKKFLPFCLSLALVAVFMVAATAQDDKSNRPSPPATAEGSIGDAAVTINYSQPAVKGREIWGGLVPYGKIWRTGANEATVFETSADLKFGDEVLLAGKYGLFTIPNEDSWEIVFNSVWDQWGSFGYDKSKDVLRITATTKASGEAVERLTFKIADGEIQISWDKLIASFSASAGS